MRELLEAVQEAVKDLDLEEQIQAYVDRWERTKMHSGTLDVPARKQRLADLLTMVYVRRVPRTIVGQLVGISRQMVNTICKAFDHYVAGRGPFGY